MLYYKVLQVDPDGQRDYCLISPDIDHMNTVLYCHGPQVSPQAGLCTILAGFPFY